MSTTPSARFGPASRWSGGQRSWNRARAAAGPHRHRHRARRRGRPRRRGRRPGARSRRRDAEPRRPPARHSPSRTVVVVEATDGFSAISSTIATSGGGPQGHRRAGAGLGGDGAQFARKSRFEALHASGVTALVGRDEELELLLRRWSERRAAKARWCCSPARRHRKSRLTAALLESSPAGRTRACAISARRNTPTARFIRSSARWNAPPDWRMTTRRSEARQARALLARTSTSIEDAALLAEMLSLANDGRYPALDLPRSSAGRERWKRSWRNARR